MSKSKGNVVTPHELIEHYRSDVFLMYLMFMGPFTDGGDWSDTGIKGISRFANRVYPFVMNEKNIRHAEEPGTVLRDEPSQSSGSPQDDVPAVSKHRFSYSFLYVWTRCGICLMMS